MSTVNYYLETCLECMSEHNIKYTDEFAKDLEEALDVSMSNYSTFRGWDVISSPEVSQVERLKKDNVKAIEEIEERHSRKIDDLKWEIGRLNNENDSLRRTLRDAGLL